MPSKRDLLTVLFLPAILAGQTNPELQQILDRLERLEKQNQALTAEVYALRKELAGARGETAAPAPATASARASENAVGEAPGPEPRAPLDERVAVNQARIAELAQSKLESEHRWPVSLTGMVLFNTFLNGENNGGQDNPLVASAGGGSTDAGATLRQTVLGLKFHGPEIFGGGRIRGSLYMDFFAGSNQQLNHLLRIRVATLEADWKNTSFVVGQDKPIISPREPNSLAQVGFSPLSGAGNLWLWQPQARIEQRFHFGEGAGLRAQVGVYETSENGTPVAPEYASSLASGRPGLEGRFELWRKWGEGRRIEIAPGFHASSTHVDHSSVRSEVFSLDWLVRPFAKVDFTGMFFRGQDLAVLGALRQGFVIHPEGPRPVRSTGGWGQISYRPTSRLSVNVYGGQQDDRNSDLYAGFIGKNQSYAANVIYRLGSNVLAGFETSQVRTSYIGSGRLLINHYDLALAYLF